MTLNLHLFYPMFSMVILTFLVALAMLRARFGAVARKEMSPQYFQTYSEGQPTESVLRTQRHFTNLFEIPVLFYAGCIVAMVLPLEGFMIEFWAWLFVASRVLHALIHINSRLIYARMLSYVIGFAAVIALWIYLFIAVASRPV